MTPEDARDRGLPRAYLRAVLLVLLADGPSHGYELLEEARADGMRAVDAGGLYRELRAMERDGVVVSWWETSRSGPPRRTYEINDAGREALAAEAVVLRTTVRLLSELLDRAHAVVPPTVQPVR